MRVVKILLGVACLAGVVWLLWPSPENRPDSEAELLTKLIKQFNGDGYYYDKLGNKRPRLYQMGFPYDIEYKTGAAIQLGNMGKKAQLAVPLLLKELENGPNDFETGHGLIRYRSEIALALAEIGDPRAIPILIEKLKAHERVAQIGPTILASSLATGVDHEAEIEALGMFGPQAKAAIPVIETFLDVPRKYHSTIPKIKHELTKDIIARYGINLEDRYLEATHQQFNRLFDDMIHVSNLIELLDNNKGMEYAKSILSEQNSQPMQDSLTQMASFYHLPLVDKYDFNIRERNGLKLAEVYPEAFAKAALCPLRQHIVEEALAKIK